MTDPEESPNRRGAIAGLLIAVAMLAIGLWLAHDLTRRDAIAQVSNFVTIGTQRDNIAEGQQAFKGDRIEWRLR